MKQFVCSEAARVSGVYQKSSRDLLPAYYFQRIRVATEAVQLMCMCLLNEEHKRLKRRRGKTRDGTFSRLDRRLWAKKVVYRLETEWSACYTFSLLVSWFFSPSQYDAGEGDGVQWERIQKCNEVQQKRGWGKSSGITLENRTVQLEEEERKRKKRERKWTKRMMREDKRWAKKKKKEKRIKRRSRKKGKRRSQSGNDCRGWSSGPSRIVVTHRDSLCHRGIEFLCLSSLLSPPYK